MRHGRSTCCFWRVSIPRRKKSIAKLRIEKPGAGYCHFPISRDREYFTQLCSERIATKMINGSSAEVLGEESGCSQ